MKRDLVCVLLISTICLWSACAHSSTDDQLLFVFEMIRHGARAGQTADVILDLEGKNVFDVEKGMLTKQGMRHRYLYGRMSRQKYVHGMDGDESLMLLDPVFTPSQIYVSSTNYHRTIQSGYSELLGFYPPDSSANILSEGELQSLDSGKGMPPMGIKLSKEVSERLGNRAIIDGYTQIPIYLYTQASIDDDINFAGCQYLSDVNGFYYHDNKTFEEEFNAYIPDLKEGFKEGWGLTDEEMAGYEFENYQMLSDEVICEEYENIHRYPWTSKQMYEIKMMNKMDLLKTFPGDAQQLWGSRMMSMPLEKLQERLSKVYNRRDKWEDLKYVLYSAHDIQVANLVEFLNFDDFNYLEVSFATPFMMEAYQSKSCAQEYKDDIESAISKCTRLEFSFKGAPLKLNYCAEINKSLGIDSIHCSYGDFLAYYDTVVLHEDLDEYCQKSFTAPW